VKRIVWFGMGAGAGALGAVWGITSLRRANQRLTADALPRVAGERVREIGSDLRAAVVEGRDAMRARERELTETRRSARADRTDRAGRPDRPPDLAPGHESMN
jgi:hypothetical protein